MCSFVYVVSSNLNFNNFIVVSCHGTKLCKKVSLLFLLIFVWFLCECRHPPTPAAACSSPHIFKYLFKLVRRQYSPADTLGCSFILQLRRQEWRSGSHYILEPPPATTSVTQDVLENHTIPLYKKKSGQNLYRAQNQRGVLELSSRLSKDLKLI